MAFGKGRKYVCLDSTKPVFLEPRQGGCDPIGVALAAPIGCPPLASLVRPGGTSILVAECLEGFGNNNFKDWIIDSVPDEILSRIQQDFILGGHKAAAIARVLKHAKVKLVSSLYPNMVQRCRLTPYGELEPAFIAATNEMDSNPIVLILPEGSASSPRSRNSSQTNRRES
jgi:nickel-dependent lactate racemase